MNSCEAAAEAIYKYSNSAMGLIEHIVAQRDALSLNLDNFIT